MLFLTYALVFCVQVSGEWVQISQQHYKKPLRPAHNHPLLATVIKPSDTTRPTINPDSVKPVVDKTSDRPRQEVSPVVKVIDEERTTKRNRIYINHTLQDNSWNTDFNEQHDFVSTKPLLNDGMIRQETQSKGDVLVVRRPQPENIENTAKNNKPSSHRTIILGNVKRVHPENTKVSHKTTKPLEEYKGPIEVINMDDLEYTTAEDTLHMKLDEDVLKHIDEQQQTIMTNTTPKEKDKRKKEPPKTNDQSFYAKPNHETNKKELTVFKGITNMRRVEILRTTKPTLTEEYHDNDSDSIPFSAKPELIREKNNIKNIATTTGVTPYRFPNIGHVKRVHKVNTTRPTSTPKSPTKYMPTEPANEEVYPTERIDTPIRKNINEKTFPVNTLYIETKATSKNRGQNRIMASPEDVMLEELITDDEKPNIKVHKVASIGTVKRVPDPTKTPEANKNKLDRHVPNKPSVTASPEIDFDEDITVEDEYSDHSFVDQSKRPEINPQIERYGPNPYTTVTPNKRAETDKMEDFDYDAKFDTTTVNNRKTTKKYIKTSSNQHNTRRKETQTKNNTAKNSNRKKHYDEEEEPLSNNKSNAMENLIKFLKTVTEIIARNTRRGVHGKVRYLEDLRDTLMANIEERIEAAFPDDPPALGDPDSRRKRSAEPRGHVEFPSSEGALMTISFLTFAVYLIKLVLQVIQAYKNKTMMMMPTVVAAVGRAYNERRTKI
ncbi:hypothetical protein O0L34_g13069 [Tuta absoluta]|nr:hypothetical protein O0L34_g13069 [Tuta absoluta]